ncbi:MAG: FAD-dependent oxidoreductase [Clostridium neonatale]
MKSYDLIVIGAGIAGMTAAIGAANKGIKNILLIERERSL